MYVCMYVGRSHERAAFSSPSSFFFSLFFQCCFPVRVFFFMHAYFLQNGCVTRNVKATLANHISPEKVANPHS